MREIADRDLDYSNLLIVVLKFFLVVIIGLQGLLKQLGLDPSSITGIVNSTPAEQVTSDGVFPISFRAVFYAPGVDFDSIEKSVQVVPYRCQPRNVNGVFEGCELGDDEAWQVLTQALDGGASDTGAARWLPLSPKDIGIDVQPETEAEAEPPTASLTAARRNRSRLQSLDFSLAAPAEKEELPIPGTYAVIYRATVSARGKEKAHWVRGDSANPFLVAYRPEDVGPWILDAAQIVEGRSGELPSELGGFASRPATPGSRLRIDSPRGRFSIARYQGIQNRSFQERISIETQVASLQTDSFRISGRQAPIQVGKGEFLRYSPATNGFVRGEFSELQPGHRIHVKFRLDERGRPSETMEQARFGPELAAILPVAVLPNQPPQAIYTGAAGASARRVILYFPLNAYEDPINGVEQGWHFNLNNYIFDPDGIPVVGIQPGGYAPQGAWPPGYALEVDRPTRNTMLKVEMGLIQQRLSLTRREDRITVLVSDDWNRNVPIELIINYLLPQEMDALKKAVGR